MGHWKWNYFALKTEDVKCEQHVFFKSIEDSPRGWWVVMNQGDVVLIPNYSTGMIQDTSMLGRYIPFVGTTIGVVSTPTE
jgi:hypothetical protein